MLLLELCIIIAVCLFYVVPNYLYVKRLETLY